MILPFDQILLLSSHPMKKEENTTYLPSFLLSSNIICYYVTLSYFDNKHVSKNPK